MTSVRNPAPGADLRARLQSVEARVHARYTGQSRRDLETLAGLRPYIEHYRRFGKTYHVLLQLESVAFRGRPLAASELLVSAMFAAEIDTLLLNAGHDLDAFHPPLIADVTQLGERYIGIGGKTIEVKPGDMSIRDREGILSTVLYGPRPADAAAPGNRFRPLHDLCAYRDFGFGARAPPARDRGACASRVTVGDHGADRKQARLKPGKAGSGARAER